MGYLLDNIYFIIVIFSLMVIFMLLYFVKNRRYNTLKADYTTNKVTLNDEAIDLDKWVAMYQILEAKITLLGQISTVGLICFDYAGENFSIDKNGHELLGVDIKTAPLSLKDFEELIHTEDRHIYDDWDNCRNIMSKGVSDTPYILRLKNIESGQYNSYYFKLKTVYNEYEDAVALICAFIDMNYMIEGEKL